MDPAAQQVMEAAVLQAAAQMEQQVDEQIHKLDNLDEGGIDQIRLARIKQLKHHEDRKQEWLRRGHGEYSSLQNEKEFFEAMKGEERMVCHFYRNNWPCQVMDKHLQVLCKQHLECKFAKIDAEKSPYLTEKLKIWMLPTLALIRSEKTVDYVVGFDELGGRDDFSTDVLAMRLQSAGVLVSNDVPRAPAEQRSVRQGQYVQQGEDDEDSDFD